MQTTTSPIGEIMLIQTRIIFLVIDGEEVPFIEEYAIPLA